jgi:hypothetical protein
MTEDEDGTAFDYRDDLEKSGKEPKSKSRRKLRKD